MTDSRPDPRPARNLWPYAIITYFAVFISAMAAWIVVALRNDVDLVRDDYYAHEVLYQKQIDRVTRTRELNRAVSVRYDLQAERLTITLPVAHAAEKNEGTIHLYRPANAKLDQRIPLAMTPEGTQRIATTGLQPGLWKVQVQWQVEGREYYFDQPVIIARKDF